MVPGLSPVPKSAIDDVPSHGSGDGSEVDYGHQIVLEDHSLDVDGEVGGSAKTTNGTDSDSITEAHLDSPISNKSPSLTGSKRFSLREELARRKYAKWQHNRNTSNASRLSIDDQLGVRPKSSGSGGGSVRKWMSKEPEEYEVDVLYENQRGSFFFGVPMFSQKSLLNLDPAPWVNVAFKDSPVDIITAQVPDPSWEWAWNSWYVDMSGDVDEEGWAYSFGFSSAYSWHGTHFWLNSFVRRRRWLRKRVRVRGKLSPTPSIRLSIDERLANGHRPSFHSSQRKADSLDERSEYQPSPTEQLLDNLKNARLDREKLQELEKYLHSDSDRFEGLPEAVSEILTMLFFEASRRHFLARLKTVLSEEREKGKKAGDNSGLSDTNLGKAAEIADRIVKQSEFWSDLHPHKQRTRSVGSASPSLSSDEDIPNGEEKKDIKGKSKA